MAPQGVRNAILTKKITFAKNWADLTLKLVNKLPKIELIFTKNTSNLKGKVFL